MPGEMPASETGRRGEQQAARDATGPGEPRAGLTGEHEDRAPEAGGRQRLEWEFLLAVRRAGSVMQILGQSAAERLGINTTDLNCVNIVALAGPMTAGELARQTGLTTASITGVLDRLEESGFVRRERDTQDRRRVLVHFNLARGRDIGPIFAPLVKEWRRALSGYSDDELQLIHGFQVQVEQIMRDQVTRLRSTPAANPSTTTRRDR